MSTVNREEVAQILTGEEGAEEEQEPAQPGFTDEAFQSLNFCRKLQVLTIQLCKAAREKKVIPVTWCIMMVSKLYSVLFSTFWLLYILALEPSR